MKPVGGFCSGFFSKTCFLITNISFSMDSRLILLRIASLYQINWPARRVHLILSLAGARLDFAILEASSIISFNAAIILCLSDWRHLDINGYGSFSTSYGGSDIRGKPRIESSQQVYSQERNAKTRAERDAPNTPKKTYSSRLILRLAPGVGFEPTRPARTTG